MMGATAPTARLITEEEVGPHLASAFPTWKKWSVLAIGVLVQISMNLNTSLYSNGQRGLAEEFGIPESTALWGAGAFLIAYAFGCELWAPWSEEFGRKNVLQLSLGLVNVFNLVVAMAPNWPTVLAGRIMAGLCTAGGSITLGMVADMYASTKQQYAVNTIVLASVGGSILGPIVGGFVETYLHWRWAMWIMLIAGVFVQAVHLLVPETRETSIQNRVARKLRKSGHTEQACVFGPNDMPGSQSRIHWRNIAVTWTRPFHMLFFERIVSFLSALSGFTDATIFMQIQSFSLVYAAWGFNAVQIGLCFIPIGIGYFLAWGLYFPFIRRNHKLARDNPDNEYAQYEARLWPLLFLAPLLPIGLLIFAWTSTGPPLPVWVSLGAAGIIGVANYAIYMSTVDYMVAAYGEYAASATGGNGWARDALAGILTPYAVNFYRDVGPPGWNLQIASMILFGISLLLVASVFLVYSKGPSMRRRSQFAHRLAAEGSTSEMASVMV